MIEKLEEGVKKRGDFSLPPSPHKYRLNDS